MIFICSKIYFSNAQKQAGQWDAGRQPLLAVNRSVKREHHLSRDTILQLGSSHCLHFLALVATWPFLMTGFHVAQMTSDSVCRWRHNPEFLIFLPLLPEWWNYRHAQMSTWCGAADGTQGFVYAEQAYQPVTSWCFERKVQWRQLERAFIISYISLLPLPAPLSPSLFPLFLSFHSSPFSWLYERTQSICTTPEKHLLVLHRHPQSAPETTPCSLKDITFCIWGSGLLPFFFHPRNGTACLIQVWEYSTILYIASHIDG